MDAANNSTPEIKKVRTKRGVIKFIILSIITCGIYDLWTISTLAKDINTIARPYDQKKTRGLIGLIFFSCITCGIYSIVWMHSLCNRIGDELTRRGIQYSFGSGVFWIFSVLLSWTGICPLIFMHKLFKSMNYLGEHYTTNG